MKYLLIALILFASCNSVKRAKTKSHEESKQLTHLTVDSASVKSNEEKNVSETKAIETDMFEFSTEFYPDSSMDQSPVIFSVRNDSLIIVPGTRKLKNVTYRSDDSKIAEEIVTSIANNSDSISLKKDNATQSETLNLSQVSSTNTKRVPLSVVLMVLIGLLFTGIAYKYRHLAFRK